MEILRFSFREYLEAKGDTRIAVETARSYGLLIRHFKEFMTDGGFPDIITGESRDIYATNLFGAMNSSTIKKG